VIERSWAERGIKSFFGGRKCAGRAVDMGERASLEQVRASDVGVSVSWYQTADRLHPEPDRDWTLRRSVEGWATDIDAGRDSVLFACQRGNVAE
jgi:hypothetical protein